MPRPQRVGLVATTLAMLTLVLAFTSSAPAFAADPPVFSEAIDAGGHTGKVWQALFTRDGKGVITVSQDKTARIWDLASGTVTQVFRMPGADGDEGRLYAAALSPDGQSLAVGGYGLQGGLHFIYLISLPAGEITKVFNGHSDVIDALAFSPDGKRLLSGSHDKTARLWNVETRQAEQILEPHAAEVYSVAFSPDGQKAVTASFDKTARVWDLKTGKSVAELKGHTAEVHCVVWSPTGESIITGGDDFTVRIWSPDGTLQKTYPHLGRRTITSLSVTADGKRALYTQGSGMGHRSCGLLELASGKVLTTFTPPEGLILSGALSPQGDLVALAGGEHYQTTLWRTSDGHLLQTLSSECKSVWSAAWSADGMKIAWGHTNSGRTAAGDMPLERTFDWQTLTYSTPPDDTYQRAKLKLDTITTTGLDEHSVTFHHDTGEDVPVKLGDDDVLNCLTLFPLGRAVLACDSGMYLYETRTGKRLQEFEGHTGRVRAVASSPDGRFLLSASEDMTLRVWDLNHQTALLTFLPAGDDWIAWAPEGYYACSGGGERLAGWRIDNGLNKVATFVPMMQFHKTLFRPDVFKRMIAAGSLEAAIKEAIKAGGGPPQTDVRNALSPQVQISAVEKVNPDTGELTIEVVAIQQGAAPIVALQVLLNGRPLKGKAGRLDFEKPAAQVRQNMTVPLTPGVEHDIVVRADTLLSYGMSPVITYPFKVMEAASTPHKLHVLAIGVDKSQVPGLSRETAAADVQRVVEGIRQHAANPQQEVAVKVLTGDEASRAEVLGALAALRKEMTLRDTAMIYFCGLAQRDESGAPALLPSDADPASLLVSAIPATQLRSLLQGLPGRVLVLLDTPTPVVEGQAPTGPNVVEDVVRELARDDVSVMTVAAGALVAGKPAAYANAILEALSLADGVDLNADGHLQTTELARHVRKRLPVSIGIPARLRPFSLSR